MRCFQTHGTSHQYSWMFTLWACINPLFIPPVRSLVKISKKTINGPTHNITLWRQDFQQDTENGHIQEVSCKRRRSHYSPLHSTSKNYLQWDQNKKDSDKLACLEVSCPRGKAWEPPFIQCNRIMPGCPASCSHSRYQFLSLDLLRDRELHSKIAKRRFHKRSWVWASV